MKKLALALSAIVLSLCLQPAKAQDATGRVIGVVTDPAGAVVPDAKITVTNVDTGVSRETVSGPDGTYQVLLVPIGMYKVTAEARGFRKIVTDPQRLEINQSLRVDVKMEIGSTMETVMVEAETSTVETINATLGASVTGDQITHAPLNGRNVLDLMLMAPGVIPNLGTSGAPNATFGGSIGGGRGDSVTYLLDGGINNNLLSNAIVYNPNPDTVAEFKVLTSNYNAEYGRNGGGIVSVVSKSGTNALHGSLYDYIRNDYFNANLFFNNANGLTKPILKRNQFGTAVGGPIDIPKVIRGKDRFFFFVAYQGQRLAQLSTTSKVTVFTPTELKGDFSRSNASGTGPDTKVVNFLGKFPWFQSNPALAAQGIIDPNRIASVPANYIKAGLVPTSPNGFLISQSSASTNNDELTEKVDLLPSIKDRISVLLGSRRQVVLSPYGFANVNGYAYTTNSHQYYGTIDYTKTFSPNLINDFRFNAQRNNSLQSVPAVKAPTPAELGIGITPDQATGPTILGFTGDATLGFSPQGPSALIDNTYTWSDTLTWIKGAHMFKTGFNYTPYQDNQVFDFYVNGEFFFYGTGGGSFSQNSRADFLMGLPDELLQAPAAPSNIRTHNIGWFFQDEWKIRRNLRLTFGIRYEYSSPKLDLQGRTFTAVLGQQSSVFVNAPKGLLFPGDANAPRGANYPDRNDWAPRFGFAWDPKGDGKTSIRGGAGVFYDILKAEDNFQFNGQSPFFGTADLFFDPLKANPAAEVNSMTKPFVAAGQPNPFPSRPPAKDVKFSTFGGGGVYFIDPHLRTPYIFQYNLSVQRELMRKTTLEVDYVGSDSHKLTGLYDSNPFLLGTTTRLFNAQPGVSASAFSYMDTFANIGKANYNGLVIGLNREWGDFGALGNMSFRLNYTHGKSIDTESGFRSNSSRVPYYNHNIFRAVSDYDLAHFVSASAVWELPFYRAWSGGPKRLTRGWTFYPILSYRSGLPIEIRSGISRTSTRPGPSGAGDPNIVQANLVGTVTFYDPHNVQKAGNGRTGNFLFDPTVIVAPANDPNLRTYGTLGRNAFRGPGRTNVDMSISKITNLSAERVRLEIIANFFNAFNHAQFNNPQSSLTSATFGQISATGDPRIIQVAGRVTF